VQHYHCEHYTAAECLPNEVRAVLTEKFISIGYTARCFAEQLGLLFVSLGNGNEQSKIRVSPNPRKPQISFFLLKPV
jgi:hypothetical protein